MDIQAIKKNAQIRLYSNRPYTIIQTNENINSTIAGTVNARSKPTTSQEGKILW